MSEPRLISPLLDQYMMGEPISAHHGVCCCPALAKATEQKFIVKIISIPASSVQLDALLLSGAYHSREAALRYFKDLADDTVKEAQLLQRLSELEGFCAYDSWQIEPMEDGSGYDVYLLGEYGNTLERQLNREPMTHLRGVNLGLDLCAALSVCRRNGYLYVDLKPENILFSEQKGYLIGDLGFVGLRSLKYASLPDKYRSAYTAPEVVDAYSSLNDTLDIYAAGMVLYQVFNGGKLPESADELTAPSYADYEMAEIILKACAQDPAERWQDPQEMGQALVSYMQRNTVNDTPIVPVIIPEPEDLPREEIAEDAIVEDTEKESEETQAQMEETGGTDPENPDNVEEAEDPDGLPVSLPSDPEVSPEEVPAQQEQTVEISEEEPEQIPEANEEAPEAMEVTPDESEEDTLEQFVIDGFLFDEELDGDAPLEDAVISDEVSAMLAQADALIAHKAPDPVIAPEPVEIPIPEPILPEPEPEPADETGETPAAQAAEDIPAEAEPEEKKEEKEEEKEEEEQPLMAAPKPRKKLGCLVGVLILILLLLLLGIGGKYYYDNYYLQHIYNITVNGAEDWLIVSLDTEIDNTLLNVYCTDTYGNKLPQSVENNQATFTSLSSGTTYQISVTIDGRHQLTGITKATYTTATQTKIVGITAIAGDTDGSVILNFTVHGPDSDGWLVKYEAPGIAEQTARCSGHMAMISGLEVGKEYTFRVVPEEELYVVSGDTISFTPSSVIYAENLTTHGFENGALKATWEATDGAAVESWTVRCYNSTGFDTTYTVTEPFIIIEGLDISQSYTLDVKALGMTVSKWTSISANSITFKEILLDNTDPRKLVITWPYEGTVPEGGWQLQYTVDGSEPVVIPCEKNTCTLDKLVPGGHYSFSFVLPEDITVYGGTAQCDVADVGSFSGYDVTAADMTIRICRTPGSTDWSHRDIAQGDYINAFAIGDTAGFVLRLGSEYVTSPDMIEVTYLIRDQAGNFIRMDTYTQTWTNLWYQGYCELDLPVLPAAGSYTVEILFNNAYVTDEPIAFTVQ